MNEITFAMIQEANKTIGTTNIKGKEYAEVNQRIKAFRMVYPTGSIMTEIVSMESREKDGNVVTFKATVCDGANILGTGYAQEKESSSFINKTSFVENCETSAVGRALGMCGFGIDTSICSADELQNAISNQNKKSEKPKEEYATEEQVAELRQAYAKSPKQLEKVLNHYKITNLVQLKKMDAAYLIDSIAKARAMKEANKPVEPDMNNI